MMLAAISAILAATAGNQALQQAQLNAMGPYVSRGKGQGRSNRRAAGAQMANIRAARKARNVRRHRASSRG
jgi:hypothetical protein